MAISARTPSKPDIHRQIIDEILVDWPLAKEGGFLKALRTLPDAHYVPEMLREDAVWTSWVRFTPDLWMIVPEDRHVVIFEAVHSHDVTDRKFAKMADLSWALDEDYYRLILVRCDRFGRQAYDVQSASLVSTLEAAEHKLPDTGWLVSDWPKYDVKYCQRYLDEAAA
jgi:hypothetical protein